MKVDLNSPLYRAWQWLEDNQNARMTADSKLAHLLVTFGGSYRPGDPAMLTIARVQVSSTCGTHNLLSAWKAKARTRLEAGQ